MNEDEIHRAFRKELDMREIDGFLAAREMRWTLRPLPIRFLRQLWRIFRYA